MRVLVTGGTGFLGRAVVRAMLARGHQVVLFGRSTPDTGPDVTAITGDVRDGAAFRGAAEGCDALVHCAGLVSIWQETPAVFDAVNVGGLENAAAAARHAGLRRLVYTSSFLALPPQGHTTALAANDYQRTKAEALARARQHRASGLPVVILVPGVLYGPGVRSEANLIGRLVDDHLAGRLPGIVGGRRVWSLAFLADVAAAHVEALEETAPPGEYGLGGENVPQRAVFEWIHARTGRRPPRELPPWVASIIGGVEEYRVRLLGGQPLVTRGAVEIFRHDWPVDSGAAIRHLAYPLRPLADGLARTFGGLGTAAGRSG